MFINDSKVYFVSIANTTAKFMQLFKRIILIARNNGLIADDLFVKCKIRLRKVDKGYLIEEEINKILKNKFASKRLEHVRDILIFSYYAVLAYIDVKNLKQDIVRIFF